MTDWLGVLAALAGVYVANRGVNTWRAQLRGQTQYDLARRLVRAAYVVRDEMRRARSVFISTVESQQALLQAGIQTEGNSGDEKLANRSAYEQRARRVAKSFVDLELEVLEAEVLWGEPIVVAHRQLREHGSRLLAVIEDQIAFLRDPSMRGIYEESELSEHKAVLWFRRNADGVDAFDEQVKASVEAIEAVARPHLALTASRASSRRLIR